jgi:hypothetical protein
MRRRSRSPSSTRWGSCTPSSTRHRGHAWGILRAVEHASQEAACRRARVAGGRAPMSTRHWRPRADEHETSIAGSDEHAGELHAVEHASPETMRRGGSRCRELVAGGRAPSSMRRRRPRIRVVAPSSTHRLEATRSSLRARAGRCCSQRAPPVAYPEFFNLSPVHLRLLQISLAVLPE